MDQDTFTKYKQISSKIFSLGRLQKDFQGILYLKRGEYIEPFNRPHLFIYACQLILYICESGSWYNTIWIEISKMRLE